MRLPATSSAPPPGTHRFPLNFKDYGIGGLSKMLGMLKMYEDVKVHSDLVFQLGAAH